MTDFTPGPWKLVGTNQHRILARFENGSDEYHAEIATVTKGQGGVKLSPEMGDANAALIAAAPELYAALEAVITEGGDDREKLGMAIAALRKARGEVNDD